MPSSKRRRTQRPRPPRTTGPRSAPPTPSGVPEESAFAAGEGPSATSFDSAAALEAFQVAQKTNSELLPNMEPPEALYHYTDAGGLQGIVESRRLRASDAIYMNDASELTYAQTLIRDVFSRFADELGDGDLNSIRDAVMQLYELPPGARPYIACFCRDGDLLSQWRGYDRGETGYALGFNLRETLFPQEFAGRLFFVEVVYSQRRQEETIERSLAAWWSTCSSLLRSSVPQDFMFPTRNDEGHVVDPGLALVALWDSLQWCLLGFKHEKFQEEAEWRIIVMVDYWAELDWRKREERHRVQEDALARQREEQIRRQGSEENVPRIAVYPPAKENAIGLEIRFRHSQLGFRPYIEVPIARRDGSLPLIEVIQGPTSAHPDLARDSLHGYLRWQGYPVDVVPSEIPLRRI